MKSILKLESGAAIAVSSWLLLESVYFLTSSRTPSPVHFVLSIAVSSYIIIKTMSRGQSQNQAGSDKSNLIKVLCLSGELVYGATLRAVKDDNDKFVFIAKYKDVETLIHKEDIMAIQMVIAGAVSRMSADDFLERYKVK